MFLKHFGRKKKNLPALMISDFHSCRKSQSINTNKRICMAHSETQQVETGDAILNDKVSLRSKARPKNNEFSL